MSKITRTDQQWAGLLTDEQYRVCRKKGTERAFTGLYYDCNTPGIYHCTCCDAPLFDAAVKFNSGSGWPSFWQPVAADSVVTEHDGSVGMTRTEVVCSACNAHLGHVFPDGPAPTGLRYCINSVSLTLHASDAEPG